MGAAGAAGVTQRWQRERIGRGQRMAMSTEMTRRLTSCSSGVRKAPHVAQVGSVAAQVGIGCGSGMGLGMGETTKPATA